MFSNDIINLKNIFFHLYVGDILKARDGKSLLGSFILTLISIDCISHLDKMGIDKWIEKNLKLHKSYSLLLKKIRNGFIHNAGTSINISKDPTNKLTEIKYIFGKSEVIFIKKKNGVVILYPDLLLIFYIIALNNYFNKLLTENNDKLKSFTDLSKNILHFYNKSFKNWDLIKYESIHPLLAPLDNSDKIDHISFTKSFFNRYNC